MVLTAQVDRLKAVRRGLLAQRWFISTWIQDRRNQKGVEWLGSCL